MWKTAWIQFWQPGLVAHGREWVLTLQLQKPLYCLGRLWKRKQGSKRWRAKHSPMQRVRQAPGPTAWLRASVLLSSLGSMTLTSQLSLARKIKKPVCLSNAWEPGGFLKGLCWKRTSSVLLRDSHCLPKHLKKNNHKTWELGRLLEAASMPQRTWSIIVNYMEHAPPHPHSLIGCADLNSTCPDPVW